MVATVSCRDLLFLHSILHFACLWFAHVVLFSDQIYSCVLPFYSECLLDNVIFFDEMSQEWAKLSSSLSIVLLGCAASMSEAEPPMLFTLSSSSGYYHRCAPLGQPQSTAQHGWRRDFDACTVPVVEGSLQIFLFVLLQCFVELYAPCMYKSAILGMIC